jgi:uncharacterized LabA/DUF88 family protein
MRNVAFLVDGAFYLKRHKKYFQQLDPDKVAKNLVDHCLKHLSKKENERLYRIFFYDCPPLSGRPQHPLTNQTINLDNTEVAIFRKDFHNKLKQTRNLALRLGYLDEKNGRWKIKNPKKEKNFIAGKVNDLLEDDLVFYAQQKTVDMKIGLDIASLAYKKLVNKIVLISGDSDFVPAAKFARREGIEFILDPMHMIIKPELQEHIDGLNTTLPKQD